MNDDEFEQLCRQVAKRGFEDEEMKNMVKDVMQRLRPPTIVAQYGWPFHPLHNDKVNARLIFDKTGDNYKWTAIMGELVRIPDSKHTVIDGINTLELERKIGMIDWTKDYTDPAVMDRESPALITKVKEVQKALQKLGASTVPGADKLLNEFQLRFFLGKQYGTHNGFQKEMLRKLNSRKFTFDRDLLDINRNQAFNLLAGRMVRIPTAHTAGKGNFEWALIKFNVGAGEKPHVMSVPDFDLTPILDQLNLPEVSGLNRQSAIRNLKEGNALLVVPTDGRESFVLALDGEALALAAWNRFGEPVDLSDYLVIDRRQKKEERTLKEPPPPGMRHKR